MFQQFHSKLVALSIPCQMCNVLSGTIITEMQPSGRNELWGAVAREKVASEMELEPQIWYLTINNPFQEGSSSPEELPVRVYLELEKKCSGFDRFCEGYRSPKKSSKHIRRHTNHFP